MQVGHWREEGVEATHQQWRDQLKMVMKVI
jgi:hypothetical protein